MMVFIKPHTATAKRCFMLKPEIKIISDKMTVKHPKMTLKSLNIELNVLREELKVRKEKSSMI